jgi:hypothetical protein
VVAWTYGKSQKVRNLERDGRATLQIEAGRDVYGQLRGAMLECDVAIERDPERVGEFGLKLMARYTAAGSSHPRRAPACSSRLPSAWCSGSRRPASSPGTIESSAARTEPHLVSHASPTRSAIDRP